MAIKKEVTAIPFEAYYFYSRGMEAEARKMEATEIFEFRRVSCVEYLPKYIQAQFPGRRIRLIGSHHAKSIFAVE